MKTLRMLSLVMGVALVATVNLRAGNTSAANPYFGTLSAVSPAELPAKAAAIVSQANTKSQLATTIDVVKAAVGLNPAAAPAIVGTIAQSTPEMAPVAAATAVALLPKQAVAIAHAAAAAAPKQAGKIVEAVCRVVPKTYEEVANSVADAAPGQGKVILAGVSAAVPALQQPIHKALAGNTTDNPSVSDVLGKVSVETATTAYTPATPVSATPTFGPPFVGIPTSPVNLGPGNGQPVGPGGRKYSSP